MDFGDVVRDLIGVRLADLDSLFDQLLHFFIFFTQIGDLLIFKIVLDLHG